MDKEILDDSKALNIADGKCRFSSNDVDWAYLLGVFNVSGIDGLANEIKRLKKLKVNPHNIIDSVSGSTCSNCKELSSECACLRNKCIKCGKSVGNITFTICDDCWNYYH